jgi:hypothetical protein
MSPPWILRRLANVSLVYNDELQIKFTFRSNPIIFCRVMALGLWNFAKYLVVTIFFHYDYLICNLSLYTHIPNIKSISVWRGHKNIPIHFFTDNNGNQKSNFVQLVIKIKLLVTRLMTIIIHLFCDWGV